MNELRRQKIFWETDEDKIQCRMRQNQTRARFSDEAENAPCLTCTLQQKCTSYRMGCVAFRSYVINATWKLGDRGVELKPC